MRNFLAMIFDTLVLLVVCTSAAPSKIAGEPEPTPNPLSSSNFGAKNNLPAKTIIVELVDMYCQGQDDNLDQEMKNVFDCNLKNVNSSVLDIFSSCYLDVTKKQFPKDKKSIKDFQCHSSVKVMHDVQLCYFQKSGQQIDTLRPQSDSEREKFQQCSKLQTIERFRPRLQS